MASGMVGRTDGYRRRRGCHYHRHHRHRRRGRFCLMFKVLADKLTAKPAPTGGSVIPHGRSPDRISIS